ncbi:MAG TPA: hypothetical protein VIL37_16685 [Natronosporangium sp.]
MRKAAQIGAGLQAVCIALPLLDLWVFGSVERHVQRAYPEWGPDEVALDRNAIVIYLAIVGVLGLAAWLGTIWAAKRDWRVRGTVTTLFVAGMGLLGINAGLGGDAYDQIVPPWLGLTLLVIPALPGVTALVAAWAGRHQR